MFTIVCEHDKTVFAIPHLSFNIYLLPLHSISKQGI